MAPPASDALQVEQHAARGQRPPRQDLGQALAQVAPQAGLDGRVVEIGRSLVHAVAGLAQQGPLKRRSAPAAQVPPDSCCNAMS